MNQEKKINENVVIIGGFVLILAIIIFTFFRNTFFSNSKNQNTQKNTASNDQPNNISYPTISSNDLNKKILLENKKNFTLLDIRPFEEYINEHILDSVNIPLDEFPIASKIDLHNLIVIIGKNNFDKNIDLAIDQLKKENFENIVVLAGGIDAWKQLIGSTVTFGNPKSFTDQAKVSYLDPESLNDALKQKVPVFIIDVRSESEYASGHIAGAKNIPFENLEKRRNEITEKKVVVVGANELQEFQASVQMYDMLLSSPFVMRSAMPGWQNKNFEVVK